MFLKDNHLSKDIKKASQMGGLIFLTNELTGNYHPVLLVVTSVIAAVVVVVVPAVISPKAVT